MFTIKNLQKNNWNVTIFANADISFAKWQKVAIIWPNGSGKSTLAKIIASIDSDVTMDMTCDKRLSIWYMYQTMDAIYDEMTIVDWLNQLTWMTDLQDSIIGLSMNYEANSELYDMQYELFEKLWWWNFPSIARNIMNIFWLIDIQLDRHIYTLSWWQKSKLLLCGAILWWADLVILDEPTNNLDSSSVDMLMDYIHHSDKSFIIISHDPEFINQTSNTIREVRDQLIYTYTWNYDDYISIKDQQYHRQVLKYEQDAKEYKQFKKTSAQLSQKANSIVSKWNTRDNDKNDWSSKVAKKLDKTAAVLRDKLVDIDMIKPLPPRAIRFDLAKSDTNNGHIHISDLKFSYAEGDFSIYIDSLSIYMWDKLYIRGSNGSGKSTLIKLITGVINSEFNNIYIHPSIKIWYFAQLDHLLSSDSDLMSYIYDVGGFDNSEVVFTLKKLGFSEDDVYKTVNTLSPWLKSKLSLAILSLQKCNCVIFDEVTNHIDYETTQQIQSAINWFDGIAIVVSHDKHFVSGINFDKILDLDVIQKL